VVTSCLDINQRQIWRGPRGPEPGQPTKQAPPTMFMCLTICTTCACHLVIFISEENLFVDAIIGRPDGSISLAYYLILWWNNYYTYCFPESRSGIWI